MSKILTPKEMAEIVTTLLTSTEIDDADLYKRFLVASGDLITDYCGGVTGCVEVDTIDGWTVGFSVDDCVPPDGGMFKRYDTDVVWTDGEELDASEQNYLAPQTERDRHVMDMLNCKENPLTREDLHALAARFPQRWLRYCTLLDDKEQ